MRTEPVIIDVTSSDVDYEDGTNISHDGRGKSWDPEERVYTLRISNTTGAELPYTGGPGTKAFPIAGGALTVLAAAALMVRLKHQRRKGGGPGS